MARYNLIRKMDISNGEGIRVSCFMQGCSFNCKGCFNPETHDFNGGEEFNENTINKILELSDKPHIKGLSILGGEPLHPKNINETIELAKAFRKKFPDKNIWLWSGYTLENLNEKQKEVLKYIDVLVDGQYIENLNDPTLKFRGSSNQRVINVQKTLEQEKIVFYYKEDEEKNIENFISKLNGSILKHPVSENMNIEDFIKTTGEGNKLIPESGNVANVTIEDLNKALEKEGYKKITFIGITGFPMYEKTTLLDLQNVLDKKEKQKNNINTNEEEL